MHKTYGFQEQKYDENISFPFSYVTMVATEVGYVSNIDIQRRQAFLFKNKNKIAIHSCFSGPSSHI
jgi:hypothetical protein